MGSGLSRYKANSGSAIFLDTAFNRVGKWIARRVEAFESSGYHRGTRAMTKPLKTSAHPAKRKSKLLTGICVAVVLLALGAASFKYLLLPRLVLQDRLNMAMVLGSVCKLYAMDHNGEFPPNVKALIPEYVQSLNWLSFRRTDGSRQFSFEYCGGSENDPPDTVLIRVPPERPGGYEVVVHTDMSGVVKSTSEASKTPHP